MKRLLFLALLLTLAPACIVIPLPSDHGGEINQVLKMAEPGSTTKNEVISILGEPDITEDRFILYKRREYRGGAVVGVVGPGYGEGTVMGQVFMDLYFEFDNFGILKNFRTDKYDASYKTVKDYYDPVKSGACDPGMEACP